MKAAGYKVPGSPQGKDFGRFTIHTWDAGDIPFIPDLAQLMTELWKKELGIDAAVVVGDTINIRQRWAARELDDNIILRTNEAAWDAAFRILGGYLDPRAETRRSQPDADPELAKILQESLNVIDLNQRQEAMARAYLATNEAHYEWQPMYANLPWGASKRIADWKPWPAAAFFNGAYTVRLK